MLKGFREFIMRGNVIDLAVAVVLGGAFAPIITTIVDGLITPLIAAIGGQPNLNEMWIITINNAEFKIGPIVTAVLNFLIIAAAIYFVVIVPMNKLMAMRAGKGGESEPEAPAEDIVLLRQIRDELRAR
jgi:large conductance mechanosensitive channel